jgi:hypothetical protein
MKHPWQFFLTPACIRQNYTLINDLKTLCKKGSHPQVNKVFSQISTSVFLCKKEDGSLDTLLIL